MTGVGEGGFRLVGPRFASFTPAWKSIRCPLPFYQLTESPRTPDRFSFDSDGFSASSQCLPKKQLVKLEDALNGEKKSAYVR